MTQKLQDKKPILIAILIMIIAQIGTNFYLVALPSVAHYFQVSNSKALDTIYFYLIPYGITQVIFAPFVNFLGFKRCANYGFGFFILGTLIIIFSGSINIFALGRTVQGIGGSIMYVIIRILIQQSYKEEETNIAFSILESFAMATPILAPIIASMLIKYITWKGLFWFMLIYCIISSLLIFKLIKFKPFGEAPKIKNILQNYLHLLQNTQYIKYILIVLFCFAPVNLALYSMPFVLQNNFKVDVSIYGFLTAFAVLGSFAGTIFSKRANEKLQKMKAIKIAIFAMFVAGIGIKITDFIYVTFIFVLFSTLLFFSYGIILPNAIADCFKKAHKKTGSEVAMMGLFQVGGASIFNFTITRIFENINSAMFAITMFSSIVIFIFYKK